MLRNFVKGCLAIALIAAMAAPAFGEAKVTGMAIMAVGQSINQNPMGPGVVNKEAPAVLGYNFYYEFDLIAKNDKVEVGTDVELMNYTGTIGHVDADWSTPYFDWKVTDAFTLVAGANHSLFKSTGFTDGFGSDTIGAIQYWGSEWARGKGTGVHGIYKINDTMSANFGYVLDRNPVQGAWAGMGPKEKGTGIHASVFGSMDAISFRVALSTGTNDDPANKEDKAVSSSAYMLAGKYAISDTMSIALDIGSNSYQGCDDATCDNVLSQPYSGQGLLFSIKNLGPGSLDVGYAMESKVSGADAGDVEAAKGTYMSLVYNYDAGVPGLGIEFDYFSHTKVGQYIKGDKAPESGTDTYIGASLKHFFF